MDKQDVSSCWDFAEAVGLDGHLHTKVMNSDKDGVPCAESTPQPLDELEYPCNSEDENVVLANHQSSSPTSEDDEDENSYNCIAQMAEEGVQSCWDLAEMLHMGGKHHDIIMNLENNKPCVESNAKPHDRMEYPCSKVEFAKRGASEDDERAAESASDEEMESKDSAPVDAEEEVKAKKKKKHHLFDFLKWHMKKEGEDDDGAAVEDEDDALEEKKKNDAKILASIPEGQCSTTMDEEEVSSCWDLATALGGDGAQHTQIINRETDTSCGESNPQPTDLMMYPCDFGSKKSSLVKKSGKKSKSEEKKEEIPLADGECKTTMDENDVDSCWDLAVAIGMDGHDHTKIMNRDQDQPCAKSNPQPFDDMIYTCDDVNKKSSSSLIASDASNKDESEKTEKKEEKKEHTLKPGQCSSTMVAESVNTCWDLALALGMNGNDHSKITNLESDKPCASSNPQPTDEMSYPCGGDKDFGFDNYGSSLSATGSSMEQQNVNQNQNYDMSRGGYEASSMQTYGYSGYGSDSGCVTTMQEQGVSTCWDLAVTLGMDGNDHVDIMNMAHSIACASSNPQPTDPMSYPCYPQQYSFLEGASAKVVPSFPRLQAHGREGGSGWILAQRHKNKILKTTPASDKDEDKDEQPKLIA